MAANTPSGTHVAAFGAFILANQSEITQRWVTVVERSPEVKASENLSYRQLLDHLPQICAELAQRLQRPIPDAHRDESTRTSKEHGANRWKQGYGLEELLREIALIRRDVVGHWLDVFINHQAELDGQTRRSAGEIVHQFFDDMVITSTRQFVEEQQRTAVASAQALSRAEAQAQAATEAKIRFVGLVSHELRTPLTPMVLAAVALAEESLSSQGRENLRVILHSARLEAAIVGDLLDASRLAERNFMLNLQPVDLHACLKAALDACALEFEMKQIRPEVLLSAKVHRIEGDYARLVRAFSAVLRKAANVSAPGGQVTVHTQNADGWIEVSITDSGINFDDKLNEAVYLPFAEGRSSPFGLGGVGVSRYVCKATIDAHGGAVSASSKEKDGGGMYVLRLPIPGG